MRLRDTGSAPPTAITVDDVESALALDPEATSFTRAQFVVGCWSVLPRVAEVAVACSGDSRQVAATESKPENDHLAAHLLGAHSNSELSGVLALARERMVRGQQRVGYGWMS